MKRTKSFSDDISTLHAVVIAKTLVGDDKRESLLKALEIPNGGSIKQVVRLLVIEYERLNITLGKDSLARVRRVVEYLSVRELEHLLDCVRNCRESVAAIDEEDDGKW